MKILISESILTMPHKKVHYNDLYERTGLNASYVQRLLDNDLKLTFVAKAIQDEYSYANSGAIGAAISFDPTQPVRDANGIYTQYGTSANLAPVNPLFLLDNYDEQTNH